MAKTIQPRTWKTALYEQDKNYHIQEPKKEDNMSLYLSLLDNLNDLYKSLCRLNYLTQKRIIERNIKSQQPRQTP